MHHIQSQYFGQSFSKSDLVCCNYLSRICIIICFQFSNISMRGVFLYQYRLKSNGLLWVTLMVSVLLVWVFFRFSTYNVSVSVARYQCSLYINIVSYFRYFSYSRELSRMYVKRAVRRWSRFVQIFFWHCYYETRYDVLCCGGKKVS